MDMHILKRFGKLLSKDRKRWLQKGGLGFVAAAVLAGLLIAYQASNRKQVLSVTVHKKGGTVVRHTDIGNLLQGTWSFMPGVIVGQDGLHVTPVGFSIVNQDGNGGQSNPPLNLYGTRLNVGGDFLITASLTNVTGNPTMQFYGGVPIIADEFRIEKPSVRATVQGNNLVVSIWSGGQQPSVTQSFPFTPNPNGTIAFSMTHQGSDLVFTMNNKVVGRLADSGVFSNGRLYFGLDGTSNWTLAKLHAEGVNGGLAAAVDSSKMQIAATDPSALQTLANKKRFGFIIGAAMALGPAVSDDAYAGVAFGGNFGQLTTENALKWQFVHPQQNVYNFHEADALVDLAARHGMKVQGHTLVFGEANPHWIRDLPPAQREAAMLDHIKTVIGHFKGKIASWDVINEPFDDDTWDGYRPNIWFQAMGSAYIAKALRAAHDADPAAKLFINEYGIEEDSERWDAMLGLVTNLKNQGVPIDGVGFQAHVYEAGDKISPSVLRSHFQQLAKLGLSARISEMDVYSDDGQGVQTSQYSQVFGACLAEPNCISFTTWGVSDRYDWFKDDDGSIQQGEDFLWNTNMQPTPAVSAVQQLLR